MTEGNIFVLAWTIVVFVGIWLTGHGIAEARKDLAALKAAGVNGAKNIVAHGFLRREFLRLLIQGVFAIAGILAIAPSAIPVHTATRILRVLFVLVVVLLDVNTYLDLKKKRALLKTLA
jgi:hypothetical protein